MIEMDAPPLIGFHRGYTDANVKNTKKHPYNGRSVTGDQMVNVPINNGTYGVEFCIS